MKLIFNDATDMPIQSYEKIGGAVRFLTIGIAPEKLKEIFEDATKTKVMNVTERGQIIDTLLINEIRSILENFVEAGFNVPIILIKGLEVADKVVNKDGDSEGE